MKNILLLLAICGAQLLFANNFTDYKNHIAQDRVLVIFNKTVSAERKAEIIQQSGLIESFTHLPSPALTICITGNYEGAKQYFSAIPEVTFVSFFITDGKAHHAGVLNDFFVKLNDKNFEPFLKEKANQLGLTDITPDKYIPNLYKIRNSKSAISNTVEQCAQFINETWCEYAAPNYLLNPIVTSDPLFNRLWHIKNTGSVVQGSGTADADMNVDSAWAITTGDPNIKVGVIDSGVDTLHGDLRANLLPGHDAVSDSTDGYPTPAYPNDGHGTCCSGIIAAIKDNNLGAVGVAPSCKIIPVRAFYYVQLSGGNDPIPYSTAAAFADAIGWAWSDAGADILSSSWALPDFLIAFLPGGTQPVNDAIATAYTNARGGKGLAMFHSSGNGGTTNGPLWPGSLSQTISVNASNMCDMPVAPSDCAGSDWSGDYGVGLDFAAPGVKITTTDMRGTFGFSNNDYDLSFSGTSASCPNAAAVGALILSVRPELHVEDVRNIIAQSCDKVGCTYSTTLANGTWCPQMGHGRVNAYRAVQQALTYSAINDMEESVVINIFPNPSTGVLNVYYNGQKNTTARVYSTTGEVLIEKEIVKGLNVIDASALPPAIYLVKTDTGGVSTTRKVAVFR